MKVGTNFHNTHRMTHSDVTTEIGIEVSVKCHLGFLVPEVTIFECAMEVLLLSYPIFNTDLYSINSQPLLRKWH